MPPHRRARRRAQKWGRRGGRGGGQGGARRGAGSMARWCMSREQLFCRRTPSPPLAPASVVLELWTSAGKGRGRHCARGRREVRRRKKNKKRRCECFVLLDCPVRYGGAAWTRADPPPLRAQCCTARAVCPLPFSITEHKMAAAAPLPPRANGAAKVALPATHTYTRDLGGGTRRVRGWPRGGERGARNGAEWQCHWSPSHCPPVLIPSTVRVWARSLARGGEGGEGPAA